MAELPKDPVGADLEDWVSAHFASRGCYVETSIKERSPDEILELDVFWTDYRKDPEQRHPVEVKSGAWGLGDVFKFYGWTRYLDLEPGEFVHKQPCEHDPASLKRVESKTRIAFMHVAELQNAEEQFKAFGLPEPAIGWLPGLWRFSFWARRRLVKSLSRAIGSGVCPESAKAAKKYLTLVNDAVFFIPDVRDRIERLLATHFGHQQLGKSAGHEIETQKVEFENPPNTRTFARAWFDGQHFPVQACLYVEHRARLYIMKALVDYWLAKGRGGVPDRKKNVVLMGDKVLASQPIGITNAMEKGLAKLSASKNFRLFPVFWQTLLWSWGGFLLNDHIDEEFAQLERETGVPKDEIPLALEAFDEIFPIQGGWFRNVDGGRCRVLILMPAVLRGLGAHRRRISKGVKEFKELGYAETTKGAMAKDNNALANLLDCAEQDLIR
jgi:hypothetical protein